VPADVLDELDVRLVTGPFPRWWSVRRNALYLPARLDVAPGLVADVTRLRVADALVVLGSDLADMTYLWLGGDGATVFVGPRSSMPSAEIHCGASSSVILTRQVASTARASVDARNGGSIFAEPDQLWASNVVIATDDMHRIESVETGERLNSFGGHIRLGAHVWLGRDAVVMGNSEIGPHSVLGTRGLVAGRSFPAHSVLVGAPARVVREGITWRHEDVPPDA
jgi:acetyltransferase-like isoleucine patch superfamily enzyme